MQDGDDGSRQGRGRYNGFLTGFLSALVLAGVAIAAWRWVDRPVESRIPSNIQAPPEATHAEIVAAAAQSTAEETASGPRAENTFDKAMRAASALRGGDDQAAETLTREIYAASRMHAFSFMPFNRFMSHLSPGDDVEYLAGLNHWLTRDPQSALARLLRAKYAYDTARAVRGPDADWLVTEEHRQAYEEGLASAEADIRESVRLEPTNPITYYYWLVIAAEGSDPRRMEEAFRQGIGRFPEYFPLYRQRLLYLNGDRVRHDFVKRYAGTASDSSPLKLLYLYLPNEPETPRASHCGDPRLQSLIECVSELASSPSKSNGPKDDAEPKAGIEKAFALYKYLDPIDFTNAVWPVLDAMRGHSYAAGLLQQAADAMGSDNALIRPPGHNNYALDDITARVWQRVGNAVNVAQKYQEALDDIRAASFANPEDAQEALATVYDHMAGSAWRNNQYAQIVTAQDAANAAAGVNHGGSPYLKCFALYKLDRFQEAIGECSGLISSHLDVINGLYYRGRSHERLKQYDAAIADFAPLAENSSESRFRWGAALEMEHNTALKGDFQGQLDIFNKYPWMFDTRRVDREDLAAVFNNRCYAYMHLGQLERALADCETSIGYGQLPDALRKEAELKKMLHKD